MTYAKLFRYSRGQAARLPLVRRVDSGVPLEPVADDLAAWFAALDRLNDGPFMPEGREQPAAPERAINIA